MPTNNLIGASVESQLRRVFTQLEAGQVDLVQLTPSLANFVYYGHALGRLSLADELARVNAEADALWERLHNPGKSLTEVRQRRIDQALEDAWDRGELSEQSLADVMVAAVASPRRATAA